MNATSIVDASKDQLASVAPPAAGAPGPWHRVGFSIEQQHEIEWCWAAVAVSIDR
ncbi:MAG: hypothetical protein JOZ05_21565, partial [Acetobacteraceae bacterium]|nr:hypothetical protein [Acetobacteraceae bacterium]